MKYNKTGLWLMPLIIISLVIVYGLYVPYEVPTYIKIGYFILVVISVILYVWGIVIVGNKPPFMCIITKWGEREWLTDNAGNPIIVYITEGWNWLLLKGFMFNVIPISVGKQEIDFPVITVTTKDGVTTEIPSALGYTVNKEDPINFLNLESSERTSFQVFEDMIFNIIDQELRLWAIDIDDWQTLQKTSMEGIKLLIGKICNDKLENHQVTQISAGGGNFKVGHFGIILNRLNLGTMKPFGPVYEASLEVKKEEQQRTAETYEITTDTEKAIKLQQAFTKAGETKTFEFCFDKIMEQKIKREANKQQSLSSLGEAFFNAKNKTS
jgi:hypothetical protein